jgi:flagellar hook-associated protein 2
MAAVSFGGVGSGIDVNSIIDGLIAASQGPANRVKQQQSANQAAISSMSDIGSLLSKLKTAASGLDQLREVGSFKVTSSGDAVAATASGGANAGSFKIEVGKLATAYKSYSNGLGNSSSNALGQSGTLSLSAAGKSADVTIAAGDSLDTVVQKINASGLRVSASTLFDGTSYRLQLRGLDTGLANDVTVNETGTTLGFVGNEQSRGTDAEFEVDDFAMTSASNQVTGVIGGVTLALSKTTINSDPITLEIKSDSTAFAEKLKTFVDAYNGVVNKVHTVSGFGSTKASVSALAGDSALRTITNQLSRSLTQPVGTGKFQTLRSMGLELNNDGTMAINQVQLDKALAEDPSAVAKILAGDDASQKGIMDSLTSLTTDMMSSKGTVQARKDGLDARNKLLTDQLDKETARLTRMEEQLKRQFNEMDQLVSKQQALGTFLSSR